MTNAAAKQTGIRLSTRILNRQNTAADLSQHSAHSSLYLTVQTGLMRKRIVMRQAQLTDNRRYPEKITN